MIYSVMQVSQKVKSRTLKDVLCHTTEEMGEIATMINKPNGEYKETLTHEIADAILCLIDLAYIDQLNNHSKTDDTPDTIAMKATKRLEKALYEKKKKWKQTY